MLTTSTRLKLQNICAQMAQGASITLQDRVYLQKFADRDRTVNSWLRRAQRHRQNGSQKGLDGLIADLDLGSDDPGDQPESDDDLGDWFSNASPWLRRD